MVERFTAETWRGQSFLRLGLRLGCGGLLRAGNGLESPCSLFDGPGVGAEGGGWEAGFVGEVGFVAAAPGEADGDGGFDFVTGDDDL